MSGKVKISPRGVAVDRCWYYEKRIALRHGSRDKATLVLALPAGGVRDGPSDLMSIVCRVVVGNEATGVGSSHDGG